MYIMFAFCWKLPAHRCINHVDDGGGDAWDGGASCVNCRRGKDASTAESDDRSVHNETEGLAV